MPPRHRERRRAAVARRSARSAPGIPERPATTYRRRPGHRPQDRRRPRRRAPPPCWCPPLRRRRGRRGAGRPDGRRGHPAAAPLLERRTAHTRRPRRRARPTSCPGDGRRALLRDLASPACCVIAAGVRRRRPRPHGRLRQGAHAVRPRARRVPGGRPADRRRLRRLPHPSPSRPTPPPGGSPRASTPPTTSPSRRTGSAPRARPRCTPASTCTAAWASTRPTRCTATSRGSPTSPTRSAGRSSPSTPSGSRTRPPRTSSSPRTSARSRPSCARYFTGLASDDEHRDMMADRHGPTYQRTIKQMGSDGWMGVGWPKEYGGHGLGEIEQTIFANEAQRADVHLPAVTLQTVGPTLIRFGTEKQKDLFLGRILAGDVHFAIGYSEPDAGTDLASLRTTARRRRRPLRRQRPEDLDHRRPPGRLPLARRAHRPGRPQAPGHLDPHRRHPTPATPGRRSSPPTARTTSTRRTSTTSGCRSTCWSARRTRAGS